MNDGPIEEVIDEVPEYDTRELGLAAFLALNGYVYDMVQDGRSQKGHPLGRWYFEDRDGEIGSLVQKFNTGNALVEPDKFLKTVNNVRNEMFEFLGIPRPS